MQALYQWRMTGDGLSGIEAEFHADNDMTNVDTAYFSEILHSVPQQLDELEAAFGTHMQERELDELDPVTQALLRMSTYELKSRIDVPYRVVINESVALAKKFGATDAHKFVNGVLDKVASDLRAVEVRAGKA
jgi:N utilization substance protein B